MINGYEKADQLRVYQKRNTVVDTNHLINVLTMRIRKNVTEYL
jgi:hypothetical protein